MDSRIIDENDINIDERNRSLLLELNLNGYSIEFNPCLDNPPWEIISNSKPIYLINGTIAANIPQFTHELYIFG